MNNLLRCLFVLLLFVSGTSAFGEQAAAESGNPVTTGDPHVPVEELKLRLRPLTQAEVKAEVGGWLKLLQEKVQEISTAEIAVSYKKAELARAGEMQQALDAVDKKKQAVSDQPADGGGFFCCQNACFAEQIFFKGQGNILLHDGALQERYVTCKQI